MVRPRSSPAVLARSVVVLIAFAAAPPAPAAEVPDAALPRLATPPVIDGALDEPAWRDAAVVDHFYEFSPGELIAPPVATVGLLGYDADFLYVGARCADPDPGALRAPLVERDHVSDQDFVQVDVDARDEGRWSMLFRVNPRGVQADGVFDETAGADDFSPDLHWESAARVGPDGWSAEFRIPISTLRHAGTDPQTWRITFYRQYPRKYRTLIASMPVPRRYSCWLCHAPRYTGITGLGRAASLTVAPFVTGSGARPAGSERTGDFDGGADLKWLPSTNLAFDLAWHPDFSQVESDAARITANERFALFYPEKRPFFLEGSDLWNSPIQAVSTRTITEPDWGVRVTGRPGDGSYTLLAAGDRGGGSLVLPGPTGSSFAPQPEDALAFLGRWRQTFGRHSISALATSRDGDGGYFNRVAGLDFQWFPTAIDRAVGQVLWSDTREAGTSTRDAGASASDTGSRGAADDHAYSLLWERTAPNYGFVLQADELGRDFRADSGFVPQVGIRHGRAYGEYAFYRDGALRQIKPFLYLDEVRELGGDLVSRAPVAGLAVDGAFQAVVNWHAAEQARANDGRLFEQSYATASLRVLPGRRVPYLKLTARYGDEIDLEGSRLGTGAALGFAASIAATDRLQAELSGERRQLDVPGAGGRDVRLFTAGVGRAKLVYTFTARSFARAIGEWRALDESAAGGGSATTFAGSLLYGYRLNWQSILYLGYDNTPAAGDAAGRGSRRDHQLFFKLAYAFRPRLGAAR